MMSPRTRWRVAFLALTALVLVMEGVAAWDGNPETDPWTDLIVAYVPWEAAVAAFGLLLLWVPVHFGYRYWIRHHSIR